MQPNDDGQMVGPLLFFIAVSHSSQQIDPDRVVYALKQWDWFWTEIVREIGPESETLSYGNGQIFFQILDPGLLITNRISGFIAIFWCGNEQDCVCREMRIKHSKL